MSKGFNASPETDPINVEDEGIGTAQEAVPVPLFWGQRKVAVRFISEIIAQEAVEAQDRPGKK